jgi:Gametolysin peptidase M11
MRLLAQISIFLAAAPISAKQLRRLERHDFVDSLGSNINTRKLTCRITVFDTLYEHHGVSNNNKDGSSLGNYKQICCIPIQEDAQGEEEMYVESSNHLYPIDLPSHILEEHQRAIHEGELLLTLNGATIEKDTVLLHDSTQVTILDHDSPIARRRRRLQGKAYDTAFGTRTLKVIRVSTSDKQPSFTAEQMEDRIFHQSIGLSSQYEACSFGQLKWESRGVLDVIVDGEIASYESGSALRVAAEEKMKQLQIISDSPSELADNVMFCLAPGTGTWVANAGTNYWRSQFNDQWCLSLTATMHEVGHNLGLGHSYHNGKTYADETGYMAAAWMDVDWPRKCFNGANHDKFHWFTSRTLSFDPLLTGPRKIQLATFVDYDKTTANEPVLVRLANKFVLQYNVAKGFNQDTEEMKNQVTIVQNTKAGTDLRAGISTVGETFEIDNFIGSEEDVVIEICETTPSTNTNPASAEKIIVGIGVFGKSGCGSELYVILDEVPEDEPSSEKIPIESTEKPPKQDLDSLSSNAPLPPTIATVAPCSSNDDEDEEPNGSDKDNHPSHHATPWKFREAMQGFLLTWETVAKRTTWFEYFIHR